MSDESKRRTDAMVAAYAVFKMGGGKEAMEKHLKRVSELKDNPAELDRYFQQVISEAEAAEKKSNTD